MERLEDKMLLKIIKFLLLMPFGALAGLGLTIIWAAIIQYFFDKWDWQKSNSEEQENLKKMINPF